jgi:hypothetical protein
VVAACMPTSYVGRAFTGLRCGGGAGDVEEVEVGPLEQDSTVAAMVSVCWPGSTTIHSSWASTTARRTRCARDAMMAPTPSVPK